MNSLSSLVLIVLLAAGTLRAEETAAEATETPVQAVATPAPTSEVPVIQAEDIASLETKTGSEVVVEGVVQSVGTGPNGNITFLNFGDRKTGFVAVIFRPAYDKFPEGFDKYSQQKVRVKGALEKYRDRQLQIKIFTPDQLEIVASATP